MKNHIIFTTDRLCARRYTRDDYGSALQFYGDVDTMALVADGTFLCDEQTIVAKIDGYIADYQSYSPYGWWALTEKESTAAIGEIGLFPLGESGDIEVGYILAPSATGRGYATEACRGAIRFGFEKLGLEAIVAVCHPENSKSIKVLEKSGLKPNGTGTFYNRFSLKWLLPRAEWQK